MDNLPFCVISSFVDIVFNIEIIIMIIGLHRMTFMDPGFVTTHHLPSIDLSVQDSLTEVEAQGEGFEVWRRVRYCKHCQKHVAGFDHHCPAFGNCIGQKNHLFFMVLLGLFIICEASFVACTSPFHRLQTAAEFPALNEDVRVATASRNLVTGTTLFCLIQILWQVVFLMWHVYCACLNIKTDEWINWKKYPEFHSKAIHDTGEVQFYNLYDKGVLRNLKEFITAKG
ncbi:uncharacterized protein LOC127259714 isoform X2 [Andrographis paniculata]|uniref:uncharacterized protein LOC127259714 isoform X2 n=1 Tax=Andrographis paniculata TaxID=175694 RepID=UPI0021E98325|nr:uncharacterized protein LOC127259714 isoform X2 [Andrographis paniculata]